MHQSEFEEIRGREASTDWVWGLLSGQSCEQVEGKRDGNKEVQFVDTISKSAGHK